MSRPKSGGWRASALARRQLPKLIVPKKQRKKPKHKRPPGMEDGE